jgi:hypothetical protein
MQRVKTLLESQKDLTECIVVHHQRFIDVSRHGNFNAFSVLMKIENLLMISHTMHCMMQNDRKLCVNLLRCEVS